MGLDLDLTLTYRSRLDFDYRYGQGWNLDADVRLESEPNGDLGYHNGYGRMDTYVSQGGGSTRRRSTTTRRWRWRGGTTTITNRFGTASVFDGSGRRTSVSDRYGNTLTYSWSGDQLVSIQDTLSRTYTLAYDNTGRLSSVTDFGGRVWSFSYSYLGELRRITVPASTQFPQGRTYWFSYSGNNAQARLRSNLIHVWSAAGEAVQTFTYDPEDVVTEEQIGSDTYTMSYNRSPARPRWSTGRTTTEWTFGAFEMPSRVEVYTKGLRQGEPASYVTTYAINGTTGLVATSPTPVATGRTTATPRRSTSRR